MAEPDPYNLRITRRDTICLSGARIPPGLVGHCHETPISAELMARQAPELAAIQQLLQDLRRRTGLLETIETVERYRRWAESRLGPTVFRDDDLPDTEIVPLPAAARALEEKREH